MRGPKFNDHFSQATLFYNSLSEIEKEHLFFAASFELGKVSDQQICERIVANFNQVHPELASRVALDLGLNPPPPLPSWVNHGKKSKNLTISTLGKAGSVASFKVAFLLADGFDAGELTTAKSAIAAAGCMPMIVGTRKGLLQSSSGNPSDAVMTDFTIITSKSTFFDAFFVVGGNEQYKATLMNCGGAINFINEAFKHYKTIGAVGEGVDFLKSCSLYGIQFANTSADGVVSSMGVVTGTGTRPSVLGTLATAASYLIGSSTAGAISGAIGPSSGGIIGQFLDSMSYYRCWNRDVKRVPV